MSTGVDPGADGFDLGRFQGSAGRHFRIDSSFNHPDQSALRTIARDDRMTLRAALHQLLVAFETESAHSSASAVADYAVGIKDRLHILNVADTGGIIPVSASRCEPDG